MKKNILKVCMMLLAFMVMIACGNKAQSGENAQEGAKTEAAASSKSGKAKKSKKSKDIKTKGRKKKKSILTPTSSGSPYEILLVAAEDDFHNGVVDSLYAVLTDDVLGVAQSEPSFKVVKITQNNFSKTLRMCSASKFKDFVTDNRDAIVDFFNKAELNRACELLQEDYQPYIQEEVKKMFGCDFWAPTELTKITKGKNFLWAHSEQFVRRVEQDLNIVIYSFPYRDLNTFTEEYFVKKRDSVMKANIPGPREGQYMMTSMPYIFVSDEEVHGGYAQVVRGLWNVKDYDMGGPFVSVSRVDEKYQRVIVAEAFVYYPNQPKRNVLKKLEAALYTLRLPDELDLARFSYDLDEIIIVPEE